SAHTSSTSPVGPQSRGWAQNSTACCVATRCCPTGRAATPWCTRSSTSNGRRCATICDTAWTATADGGRMPSATADLLAGVGRVCLALAEGTEGLTHGGETWFVRRRSFAKFVDPEKHRLDERHVAFWAAAPSGDRQELVAEDPQRFFVPRFGGYDWVGMRLDLQPDGCDWQEV